MYLKPLKAGIICVGIIHNLGDHQSSHLRDRHTGPIKAQTLRATILLNLFVRALSHHACPCLPMGDNGVAIAHGPRRRLAHDLCAGVHTGSIEANKVLVTHLFARRVSTPAGFTTPTALINDHRVQRAGSSGRRITRNPLTGISRFIADSFHTRRVVSTGLVHAWINTLTRLTRSAGQVRDSCVFRTHRPRGLVTGDGRAGVARRDTLRVHADLPIFTRGVDRGINALAPPTGPVGRVRDHGARVA